MLTFNILVLILLIILTLVIIIDSVIRIVRAKNNKEEVSTNYYMWTFIEFGTLILLFGILGYIVMTAYGYL